MSEEIINNETTPETQEQKTEINSTPSQEQGSIDTAQKGSAQTEEKQKESTDSKYVKVGREIKQQVTAYTIEARNALAREVTEIQRNKETLLIEKQTLIDKFNQDMCRIEAELKTLESEAKTKSEIACTGEKREAVLCDAYQTKNEIIYIPVGGDPEKDTVIARTQRTPEEKQEEK